MQAGVKPVIQNVSKTRCPRKKTKVSKRDEDSYEGRREVRIADLLLNYLIVKL